jgi:hypothetical protein
MFQIRDDIEASAENVKILFAGDSSVQLRSALLPRKLVIKKQTRHKPVRIQQQPS